MTYMIAAYGVIWLLTFVFIASILIRQRRMQRDLALMEELLTAQQPPQADS